VIKQFFIVSIIFSQFLVLLPLAFSSEKPPRAIGGFILGTDITNYPDIENSNFLKEVVIYDWHGFDKGIISYAICEKPGEIVRIKFKYSDSSKKYFDLLLDKYKEKYGNPSEWKGDSFGILHIWKWKFVDENENRVHLILQHNTRNPNENTGNMVKLYYPDNIIREQACFSKQCSQNINKATEEQLKQRTESDWTYLIPQ